MSQKLLEPSRDQMYEYHAKWDGNAYVGYRIQEDVLNGIWRKYPKNINIKEIEVKVNTLNLYYSPSVIATNKMARHIYSIKDIDNRLSKGDLSLVKIIAHLKLENGKERDFYSFATKYCSFHAPNKYPIYDSYVQDLLYKFQKKYKFYPCIITHKSITDYSQYPEYKKIVDCFITRFELNCSYKELDQYLWTMGKEEFPRESKKRKS